MAIERTQVTVNAPGFKVVDAPDAGLREMAALTIDRGTTEALAKNNVALSDIEPIPIALVRSEPAGVTLTRSGSPWPHVEIVAHPRNGHTLLLMMEQDDLTQWFVPVNAARVVPRHAGMRAKVEGAEPVPLRFLVPSAAVQPRSESQRGSIFNLVHIPLLRDLVDAPVRWLIAHIAKHIESKNKKEGFKFFDDAGSYPAVAQEQMQTMAASGLPVLFLTHGVFSSLRGAFRELYGSKTLAALREKYGERIIGWDHWTISKTPLENADEMLTRMAPAMNVDFICHSRGALVMRAALEHAKLRDKRRTRFLESGVGSAMFVAGANQGSQLASFAHVNTLLNVYWAFGQLFGNVALEVVFAVLRILAHGASTLPSVQALSSDPSNKFVRELDDQPSMSIRGKLAVAHANYDPRDGVLKKLANLNIDAIFGCANDLVVPFAGAAEFDPGVEADHAFAFGSATTAQTGVWHTQFFGKDQVTDLIRRTLLGVT